MAGAPERTEGRHDPGNPQVSRPPTPGDALNAAYEALLGNTADTSLRDKLNVLRFGRDDEYTGTTTAGGLTELTPDQELLASLLVTAANGDYDMPQQTVTVEYLKTDQRLLIPAPLGYDLVDLGKSESRVIDEVIQRYTRAALLTYSELKAQLTTVADFPRLRAYVDTVQIPDGVNLDKSWVRRRMPLLDDGTNEDRNIATMTISLISQALQLNCDIRDVGYLAGVDARVSDAEWTVYNETTPARLRVALAPYTMQMIAALNYPNVAKNPLAAWVRAHGLATGLLPVRQSRTQVEYQFTYAVPANEDRALLAKYELRFPTSLYSVCMNVLAMFGLLHLNKDHTFKSADSNMERICVSWVMTLRTIVSSDIMDGIRGNLEPICRTGPHPFGLAQTYWLAKSMANLRLLSSPLAIREFTTPPPVQRLMIIRAASREWASLPTGQKLNRIHANHLATLEKQYDDIMVGPPSYSGLYRLYGENNMTVVSAESKNAIDAMMPIVYGFALAMHVDESRKKDGLALAMSLDNVLRDNKVLARSFEAIWTGYLDDVAKMGLTDFLKESANILAEGVGTGG